MKIKTATKKQFANLSKTFLTIIEKMQSFLPES